MNMEIIWTGLSGIARQEKDLVGHTSVWMFFVYGIAAFILEPVYTLICGENFFVRGCVWASLIFAIEFTSGAILRMFGIEAWNYTGELSVLGLIRLDYAPLWFAVGLLFERVYGFLLRHSI